MASIEPSLSATMPDAGAFAVPAGWRFTALLIFTQLPGVIAYTIPLPLLAGLAGELAHDATSAWLAKMVLGILGPSMAVGALGGGWLADKADRRWLIIGMGAIYLLASVAPAFLDSLVVIVLARFVTGMMSGALAAVGMTMVGDYLPENKRAGTIGMLSALNMIASLVTLPMGGFVGDFGWRHAFLLYLLALPVVVLASLSPLPVPPRPPAQRSQTGRAVRWYSGVPLSLFLLSLAVGVILTVPGIYVSFHLATIGLGKASTVSMLMMLNSALAAVFSSLFGRAWGYSPRAVFVAGFSAMGVGLMMLAYATGPASAGAALLLMGIAMGLLAPSVMARVVDMVEEGKRGQVVGAAQGLMAIAPLIVLSALEPLLPRIGTIGVMAAVGALSLGLFAVFALQRVKPGGGG